MLQRCSATGLAGELVWVAKEHEDVLLNELFNHPGFEVLKKRLKEQETDDALILARTILQSNKPIDQQQVDERRGFWRGADWFIRETKRGASAFTKGVEQE